MLALAQLEEEKLEQEGEAEGLEQEGEERVLRERGGVGEQGERTEEAGQSLSPRTCRRAGPAGLALVATSRGNRAINWGGGWAGWIGLLG